MHYHNCNISVTSTVTINEDKITTSYGKSLTLSCEVSVICTCFVKSVEWYRNGQKIEFGNTSIKCYSDRKHPKLAINEVDENDAGDYRCVIETIFSKHSSDNIQVVYGKYIYKSNKNNTLLIVLCQIYLN